MSLGCVLIFFLFKLFLLKFVLIDLTAAIFAESLTVYWCISVSL